MKRKKILKEIILILTLTLILIITNIKNVEASLQSNQNSNSKTESVINWMKKFRQMETEGDSIGLSETLNEDLTPSSESNGIDIHMIRATEYGAIAILSASEYGNSSNEPYIESTTGNDTGVMLDCRFKPELVAGGLTENNVFAGINERYYDTYTESQDSARIGDALGSATTTNPGCAKWHETIHTVWFTPTNPCLVRSFTSIFGFYNANPSTNIYSRGIAVCGAGI